MQIDHAVDVVALKEELCLAGIAREPIDNEAEIPIVLVKAAPHHGFNEVVANEVAGRHDALHLGTKLGAMLHVPPEDIADADVLEIQILCEQFRLGSLATALDPHDHVLTHAVSSPYPHAMNLPSEKPAVRTATPLFILGRSPSGSRSGCRWAVACRRAPGG